MRRSSESSDPRKRSLHRRVSLLRRSEVGNASGSGSILDDDTNADWNEMEPQWWKRLDKGPDKRASANYLPVNRPNTPNYSEILVEESRTIRISVVEDEDGDDSTFDSMPTMSPMAFTKKKGLFKKKMGGATTSKALLALPAPEMPSAVEQTKTVATDSDADSYLESLHFHSEINVHPEGEMNLRTRNKNLFKNKKNNHMTFSKAVDTSFKVDNNSGSIDENQSVPVLTQKRAKKLFMKNSKPRNSLFADALSHLESNGSVKGDLESNEVNKSAEVETISKHQEMLKRRSSGRVGFSQRRISDAESIKSGPHESSPSSIISDTINFDRWTQLASSTMLEGDKTPKTMNKSNFKGSRQSLSGKLAILHSDIMEELSNFTELPPSLEHLPKVDAILPEEALVESQERNISKNSPATERSNRLSKNSPKSTVLQNTPDLVRNVVNKKYSDAYLEDAFGMNEMNKTEGPVLPCDEAVLILPKNQSQRQSVGTWLQLEEIDKEMSLPLSQSDVDRQVIEEMMAKRTNPPVRRSAHFSKQNFHDVSESEGEMHQTHKSITASTEHDDADHVSIEKLNASTDKQCAIDKHQLEENSGSRNKIVSTLADVNVTETLAIVQSSTQKNKKSVSHSQEQVENVQILDIAEKGKLELSNGIVTDTTSPIGSPIRSESPKKSQSPTTENSGSLNVSLNRSRKLQNSSQHSVKDNQPDLSGNKSVSHLTGNENVLETLPIDQSNAEENKSIHQSQEQLENLELLAKSQSKINIESNILDPNTNTITIITSPHGSPISSESRKSQTLTTEDSDSSNMSLNPSRKLLNSSQQSAKNTFLLGNKSVLTLREHENVPEASLPIDHSNVEENKSINNSQKQVRNLQILDIAEKGELNINVETDVLELNAEIVEDIISPRRSPARSKVRRSQTLTIENIDSSLSRLRKLQSASQQSVKDNHSDLSVNKSVSEKQVGNLQILDIAEKGELNINVETEVLESNTEIVEDIISPRRSSARSKVRRSQTLTIENDSSLSRIGKLQSASQQSVKDNHSDLSVNKSVSEKQVGNLQILDIAEKSELNVNVETKVLEPNTEIFEDITSAHGSPTRSKVGRNQTPNTKNIDSSLNRLRKLQSASQQSIQDNHPDLSGNRSVSTLTENENLPEKLPVDLSNVEENKKSLSITQNVEIAEKSELEIIVESEVLNPSTDIIPAITSPHRFPIRSESRKSQALTTENTDSNILVNQSRKMQNSSQQSVQDSHPVRPVERPLKVVSPETSLSSSTGAHNSDYPSISADVSRNTFNSMLRNASAKDIWKDSVEEQVTPLKRIIPNISVSTHKQVSDTEDSDLSANVSVDRSRKILNSAKRRATDIWQDSVEGQATLTPMKTTASTHFEDNSISFLSPAGPNSEPSKSIHRANVSAKRKFTEEELKEFTDRIMSENAKQAKIVEERLANRFIFQPYLSIPKVVQVKQKPMAKSSNVPRKSRVVKPKNTEQKVSKKPYMKEEWITKKLYNFVEKKLKPQYGLNSLNRTEKFIKDLAGVVNIVLKSKGGHHHYVDTLKREMARLQLVTTYFDFCCFIHEYLPFYFRIKSIAAEGRDVPEFTGKVFEPILNGRKKK